jgi:hypothetical protein
MTRALLVWCFVCVAAPACILNPQPLPPDQPDGSRVGTNVPATDAGSADFGDGAGGGGADAESDAALEIDAEAGSDGGDAGWMEGGEASTGDASGKSEGGKPVEGGAADATWK